MANRPSNFRVDASSVQGEGSFVTWQRLTWGERKEVRERAKVDKLDVLDFLVEHLAGWNWVDSDGNPLELPKSQEDLDKLFDEEITFLADVAKRALDGRLELTPEAQKN